MSIFDDIWSWLTTSPNQAQYTGPLSPTASTQTPIVGPLQGSPQVVSAAAAPILGGGVLPNQGLIAGLLGGQQPANPMSYFTPRQGLLGNSPLGMGLRGGFAGLAAGAGQGGLSGLGAGAMGGQQEEMQRRQNQMQALAAGQQYLSGQYGLVGNVLQNQATLQQINYGRYLQGLSPVTMNQVLSDPTLAASAFPGQQVATAAPTTGTGTTAPATGGGTVIVPGTTYSAAPMQRTLPSGSTATIPGQQTTIPSVSLAQLKQGFSNLEGGVDKVSGAIGGLTQGTFNQYAKPGESFDNPQDRAAVTDRVINDLAVQSGGDPAKIAQGDYSGVDPARVAVGWFSGPGNIAPLGTAVPWNYDAKDAHGTTTSGYVANFAKQLGQPPAQGQGQQPIMTAQLAAQPAAQPAAFPQTIPEVEASNLPDWAKSSLINAYYSRDPKIIADTQEKIGQYMAEPGRAVQQAAATTTATAAAGYGTQQEINKTAEAIRQTYTGSDAYKTYTATKPAADAFRAAYAARGPGDTPTADYPGDYDLVINAIKAINPDMATPKPGTLINATDLPTLPASLEKMLITAWNKNTALPRGAVDQLNKAVQNAVTINQKNLVSVVRNMRTRANSELPPNYPETNWRLDASPDLAIVTGDNDYKALPSGQVYVGPDGITRTKP